MAALGELGLPFAVLRALPCSGLILGSLGAVNLHPQRSLAPPVSPQQRLFELFSPVPTLLGANTLEVAAEEAQER